MAQYEYTYEFQRDIIRVMAHDPEFLLGMRKAVEASYFSDTELSAVAGAMLSIFDETHARPSLGNVLECIEDHTDAGDDVDEVQDVAREAYDLGLPGDCAMIRDRVREFGLRHRLQEVLLSGAEFVQDGQFNEFVEAAREAVTVQADADSGIYDYYEMLERRLRGATTRATEAIPTGIFCLDRHLPDGGLARGEMALLMGLPGYGKTTTLINIGVGALRAGKRVFHATVGDMSEAKVGNRYDSCITGHPIHENRMQPERTLQEVGEFLGDDRDRLIIKFWPSNRVSVPDLERHLRWLEASRGWKPDVLIVDYAANMSPRKDYEGRMIRLAHEEVYKDLRALGGVLGCAVWSAIQANREAFNINAPGMGQAAESFGPMRDTDICIGIGMTPEERDEGWIKYRGAKVRDSEAEWLETTGVDFSIHRVYERDDFDDEEHDDDDDY